MTDHQPLSAGELVKAIRAAQAPTLGAVQRSRDAAARSWVQTKQMSTDRARQCWVEDLDAITRATHQGLQPAAVAHRLRSLAKRVEADTSRAAAVAAEPSRAPQREHGVER